jgi:hypothetical protein
VTYEAAEIVDTSHVDQVLANARKADENVRRRAMIWTIGKSTLLGGVGLGLLCFGASFLVQPKIVEVPKVVEIPEPRVIETTKVVETPKVIETTKLVEGPAKVIDGPKVVEMTPPVQPPPPVAATPNPGTETHTWDELTNKHYLGVITDVGVDYVCYDHHTERNQCTHVVVTDANGRAVLDRQGNVKFNERVSMVPMRKWIGYSAYSASRPEDPVHLADFWVANSGTLVKYELEPKG